MLRSKIVIVGAGVAGLTCARALANAGYAPLVLEKGRGVGGRISTRRAQNGMTFDHGAQYFTAKSNEFRLFIEKIERSGGAAVWDDGSNLKRFVGTPGMNALAKHLAADLDVQTGLEVDHIAECSSGWEIKAGNREFECEKLIVTAPAPQTAKLIGKDHTLYETVSGAVLAPCLTLMAAFEPNQPQPFISRREPDDILSWIALDSSKPGRSADNCWVAQAGPKWSAERLEQDLPGVARDLLVLLCDRIGADISSAFHAVAHRWRYANVVTPIGSPFLRNENDNLFLGGDWCLKGRIEAAWASGNAIAERVLEAG